MTKLSPNDRAEILLTLQDKQLTALQLALKFGVSARAIYNVKKTWDEERRVTPAKRPGFKPKVKAEKTQELVKYANSHPYATLAELKDKFDLPYQLLNISMILKKHGLRCFVAKKKHPLTKKAKDARIKFVKDNEKLDCDKVVFTDEKTVQNFFNGRARVRRLRGQVWLDRNALKVDQTRSCNVYLWGFISKEQCGVYLVPNKFKSQHYKEMLEGTFFPEIKQIKPDFIFMQDNASIHKAELVMNYLKEESVNLLKWPPRSPDLNPIENIWAEMQRLVNSHML